LVDVETGDRMIVESHQVVGPANDLDPFMAISVDRSLIAYSVNRGFAGPNTFQQLFDLVVAPVGNLAAKRSVARSVPQWFGADISWSPDGRYLAWYTSGPVERGDLYVYDVRSSTSNLVTPGLHPIFDPLTSLSVSAPVWLDNRTIIAKAFDGPLRTHYEKAKANSLWMLNVATGAAQKVTSFPGAEIFRIVTRPPSRIALRSGDAIVVAIKTANHDQGLYAVDLSTGRARMLVGGRYNLGYATGWDSPVGSPDGRYVVYVGQSSDEPPNAWVVPANGGAPRRVTDLNPDLAGIPLGGSRILSYLGPDGDTLRSALLLPPGWIRGRPVPMIVYPYGGADRSLLINNFGFARVAGAGVDNLHVLATRGYGILLPDAPVHTGTPMRDIARTVLSGVDEAVRLGYADPTRVGIIGHSYGGYTVYSLIVQTHRFKAAIAVAGFSDWVVLYSGMQDGGSSHGITQAEARQYGLGATPWKARQRFIANSPFYFLDRLTTPTLIIHGTDDPIDQFNAKMSFVALRRLGKDVALVLYRHEQHSPAMWSHQNQEDYLERVVAWFNRYLCPQHPAPQRRR
jgi:acetyl esterase/lipase